jgi:anti-sigma regulatory factor (Ser/Thr protein kinase)
MLAGVGETLAFDAELLDDLKTAVSEACNNVVIHAYGDGVGLLDVDCEIGPEHLQVWVRDEGAGIRGVAPTTDRMGVGLAVISALTDQASFSSRPDGGTEVRMSFDGGTAKVALPEGAELNGDDWSAGLSGAVVVRLAPTELLPGVLGRISRALAARARFSVDRLSDLYPVTDAIAAHARAEASDSRVGFAIDASERRIELMIGPFETGSVDRLTAGRGAPHTASPLALLASEVEAVPHDSWELLRVVVADDRQA